jgi:hypothetical protein
LRKGLIAAVALLTAGFVAGCGAGSSPASSSDPGSSPAHRLLMQTFTGHHTIESGVMKLDLRIVPTGSSTVTQPVELSFSGPFASRGTGKLPESDFTIAVAAQGQRGALQVISAGGKGYITVGGQSYEMPASSFKHVESGVNSLAGSSGGSSTRSGAGAFSKLGIRPLDWLSDPRITGSAVVNGAQTTRVHAKVDAAALLRDLSRLLGKAGSLGVKNSASLPSSIAPATQSRIAKALGSPSFDVWTGKRDKVVRKLTVAATIPVTGQVRSLLGGMSSAAVTLDFEYSDLNQPQTIHAPASVKPYSVFQTKVDTLLQQIESGLATGSLNGTTTSTTTTGSATATTTGGGIAGIDKKYANCITRAAGDVKKMQKCSSLLGSG